MRRQQNDPDYYFNGYNAGNENTGRLSDRFFAFFRSRLYPSGMADADSAPLLGLQAQLDPERDRIERGPGGDVDVDGEIARRGISWMPVHLSTICAWQRLYERVQANALGGPEDGAK
ncbi:MAG TPA: hypothetical protein VF510_18180 [Ktedonobacterales bacterium]